MPRIPDIEITRLKQAVALTRLAEARGVELKGQGSNLLGLCPFHDDKTPSLVVDPVKNLWNCLGACGCGGSNIDWVMRDHGVGFRVAAEIIAEMAGGALYPSRPVGSPSGPLKQTSARRLANPLSPEADGDVLLGQVADYYHKTLVENPMAMATAARAYLAKRGLDHEPLIREFRIGYADRSLGLRIPDKARREGGQLRLKMTRLGLLRESGHEQMSGAVVVPIVGFSDADSQVPVVGMYGRMTTENLRQGTAYHRYLSGQHRAAWNAAGALRAAAATADGALIVCEAIIDALTFWRWGFQHVTAAYGVHGFTPHHRALVAHAAVQVVYLAYDNDDAGNTAAATLADELILMGKAVYRVEFPVAVNDANGLACASADPAAALGAVLKNAEYMGGHGDAVGLAPAAKEVQAARPVVATSPAVRAAAPAAAPVLSSSVLAAAVAPVPVVAAVFAAAPVVGPVAGPVAALAVVVSPFLLADGDDFAAQSGPRRYRVRGLLKNVESATLRVGLRLTVVGVDGVAAFHQDTIDLCQAKQRAAFQAAAAETTRADSDAIKTDLGRLLDAAETAWEAHRRTALTPAGIQRPPMDPAAEAAARAFLRTPDLLERIAADYDACGIVGDAAPKLVSYLCAVSRRLDQPLAVLTMAPSAAGKTSLQDGTLAFVPDEERLSVSAMTGQALHYIEEDLSHRVLAIAEEEGASRAAYSLKLLQSEGKISLAVPIKDAETGQIVTRIKEVRGPVALFLTTTAPQIDEELANRCIVLTVDESAEQTARVHAAQRERETIDGLLRHSRSTAIRDVHQNAQRLLERVAVVNPYARQLRFRADRPRTRRDHMKYLGLIRVITYLHQHQRPRHIAQVAGQEIAYIEVTRADIAAANSLAAAVLGRSLDELAPQTRALLLRLDALVSSRAAAEGRQRGAVRFTRRDVREFTGFSQNQVRDHLARLIDMEYVIAVRGSSVQGQTSDYVLAYDGQGQDGQPFLMGLTEVDDLDAPADEADGTSGVESSGTVPSVSPQAAGFVPPVSPTCPPVVRGVWIGETIKNDGETSANSDVSEKIAKTEGQGGISESVKSYPTATSQPLVAELVAAT